MSEHSDRPYKCKVDIALPSSIYAKHLRDVLSVDGELGNKIVKSFSVVSTKEYGDDDDNVGNGDDDVLRILRMYVLCELCYTCKLLGRIYLRGAVSPFLLKQ